MSAFKSSARGFLIAVLFFCMPFSSRALETADVDIEELEDAEARSASPDWLKHVDTGERTIDGLDILLVASPDEKWMLLGKPVEGLDVITYELYLLSTVDFKIRTLSTQAVDATFSPASDFLFVATGPHPIIFNLEKMSGTVLANIQSGLENYPVWVSEWSDDDTELIIHQQARFDDSSEPRAWKIIIAP